MFYLRACLVLLAAVSVHSTAVRGVHPDLLSRYSVSSTFTCLDGSKTIPSAQLNDNYCDCADGTDEPGTSACPNTTFYCKNPGFQEKQLPSQFVDDGVCDCCDGTDEQPGKCKDSCFEASSALRQEIRDRASVVLAAVEKKRQLMAEATAAKAAAGSRRATIDGDIASQEEEVKKLEEEAARLEEEEEKQRQADLEKRLQEQTQQKAAAEEGETTTTTINDVVHEEGEGHEGHVEGEEGKEVDAEELGRKIASQWTHDPEAAGVGEDEHANWDHDHDFDHDSAGYDDEHPYGSSAVVNAAKDKVHEAKDRLEALQKEKAKLNVLSSTDLGPSSVFYHLAGNCYAGSDMRFSYEACFFGDATQTEGSNGRWGLGSWEGFKDNYRLAVFSGGEQCWDGPKRSLTLELECGSEVKLHTPTEPSPCVYAAKLSTPAACGDQLEVQMKKALSDLDLIEKHAAATAAAAPVHDEL